VFITFFKQLFLCIVFGRGVHSSTFQLNLSRFRHSTRGLH
jgi:hypothetical protein